MTANEFHVYSVICFLYKEKQYLGASGEGDLFEVFDVSKLEENEFLCKDYIYWCTFTLFLKALFFFVKK